ncbi:MAG: CPBP family intramembrane glutamic endopeptidase [Planctomycetota bacterium]
MNTPNQDQKSFFRFACGFELAIGLVGVVLSLLLGPDFTLFLPSLTNLPSIGSGIAFGLLAALPTVLAVWWMMKLPWESIQELKRFGEHPAVRRLLALDPARLILLSLCSGIGEELAFRGWLLPWLLEFSESFVAGDPLMNVDLLPIVVAVGVSSLLFGVVHPHTRLYMAVTGLIGIYYAGLLILTDNLLVPIVAHAAHNAAQFLMSRQEMVREVPSNPMHFDGGEAWEDRLDEWDQGFDEPDEAPSRD